MDRSELDALGIVEWSAFKTDFTGSDLLLDNGFSLSMWPYFNYESLFDRFLATCEEHDRRTFELFDTSNFEFILEDSFSADRVNRVFDIDTRDIDNAIHKVRSGLIHTIHDIHPAAGELRQSKVEGVAQQLESFSDIYTVNYDALIYQIIMLAKDRYEAGISHSRYNDYFWNRVSSRYLQFMDYQNYRPYKHIYYLHGALFLFRGSHEDLKLRRASDGEELLNLISRALENGDIPLFVSEGTSSEKLRAISRSHYLRLCYDKLRERDGRLVMYGILLSPTQDQHIIDAIKENTEEIAVAVYQVGRTERQLRDEMEGFGGKFPWYHLRFFDATTLFQAE